MTNKIALFSNYSSIFPIPLSDNPSIQYYSDTQFDSFLVSNCPRRIALIQEWRYNDELFNKLELAKQCCDQVVFTSMELLPIKIIERFDVSTFTFILPTIFNTYTPKFAKIYGNFAWLYSTSFVYHNEPVHEKINSSSIKPYWFDVLYGRPRPHRVFVKEQLSQSDKQHHFLESPFFTIDNAIPDEKKYNIDQSEWWEDDLISIGGYECTYRGRKMNISQVIPFKIYEKSACSIVCETYPSNDFSFFTEKIAKPLIAGRLFIVIAGQHYLRNLRSLGFKTFDGIIDETYDSEPNNEIRWQMAIEQAISLTDNNQQEIYDRCKDIFNHNQHTIRCLNTTMIEDTIDSLINVYNLSTTE